ncbi:MAG: acyltransferase, partial [Actinomycetota bacterium]|nr:acyltransferase [Actinomycetota bacterium]
MTAPSRVAHADALPSTGPRAGGDDLPRHSRFRRDIQALRALAVAVVVLYHLWPGVFPGGFVGVDVFFVISGFLITQHLVDEMDRTGRISLTRFWARRIRRLLPAAFTVLAASLAVLVLLMPRVTWDNNLQEIRASALYVENWLLGRNAVDYLAAENSASLVQHYWSLSAEEQFYLVWPLLLLLPLAGTRLFRRAGLRRLVLAVLAAAAVASFAVSVVLTAREPELAFFATPARAWQFAVGGVVAVLVPAVAGPAAVRALAGWAGLATILWSTFALGHGEAFPGSVALIPVAGAALVLAAGTSPARWSPDPVARRRFVQWLGDNSYSVYLWHWPLIIAAPWVLPVDPSLATDLGILAATLLLAALTKRWVEDPVRSGTWWRSRSWPSYAFAAAGMAVVVAVTNAAHVRLEEGRSTPAPVEAVEELPAPPAETRDGRRAGSRRAAPVAPVSCHGAAAMVASNRCTRPYKRPGDLDTAAAAVDGRGYSCLQSLEATVPEPCRFGRKSSRTTVAVVGNSHARHLAPALDAYGKRHGWTFLLAAKIDCMGLVTAPVGSLDAGNPCLTWSRELQRTLLSTPGLDAVVFASHANAGEYLAGPDASPGDVREAEEQVLDTWSAFAARDIDVIVLEDVPGMRPELGPECIARSRDDDDPCAMERSRVLRRNMMTELAQANPDLATYQPLRRFFCDTDACHALIGGVVVYYDAHHLTATFARSMAPYLGADLRTILTRDRAGTAAAKPSG